MQARLQGDFGRFWTASAISSLGTSVTAVAMPVLVVQVLHASPAQVGLINAAQLLPYAALGLLVGAYVDRRRRRPLLVLAGVGRGVTLGAIPVLWLLGVLHVWVLIVALLAFGSFAVIGFAAGQSLLPRLVARHDLVRANARLDQSDAAAQTLGPVVGGGAATLLGAPVALAVDAVSYLAEATLVARMRFTEPPPQVGGRRLGQEIAEGVRWTYRHPTLGPLALSTHLWFFANAAGLTVLSLLALRTLGLSPFVYGVVLAAGGVATFAGATLAPHAGTRSGPGRVVIGARAAYPCAWVLVLLSPTGGLGVAMLVLALVVQGFAGGLENANEMGLRQTLTPDAQLGRTNATIRSANRTVAALGAVAAGAVVTLTGERPTLVGVAVVLVGAWAVAAFSPLRSAPGAVTAG
ncbi:MAG TPA: MFS transporter [Cellulomonas sp.]